MIKLRAKHLIKKYAKEYLEEFKKVKLAEADEGFYTFIGDKHYFEFEMQKSKLKLLNIRDIEYGVI